MAKKEYKLKIKTDKDSLTDTYGKFVLQPLEPFPLNSYLFSQLLSSPCAKPIESADFV